MGSRVEQFKEYVVSLNKQVGSPSAQLCAENNLGVSLRNTTLAFFRFCNAVCGLGAAAMAEEAGKVLVLRATRLSAAPGENSSRVC